MSEDAPELTAELVVDGAVPSQPVISPDGRWVAYVVAPVGRGGERHLCAVWVAAVDGGSPPWKLTAGTAADSDPRWAPDSASVFFLSDRTGSRQLYRVRVGGGEAEVLTDWRGEISDARPLAEARVVAVVATDEPTDEDERRRVERDDAFVWGQQLSPARLRLLDLATGELRTVDSLGDRHVAELAARPDGGALAAISWADPDNDPGATTSELHVVDLETGTARGLGRIGTEARSPVWWQADGSWHVAYLAMPEPFGGDAVYDVDVSADTAVHRDLTAGMAVCPTELAQVTDGPPLALFADGLDTAIYLLDPGLLRFGCVSARDGLVDSLTACRSGEAIAALASTSYAPANVHAGPPGGQLIRLSDTQPELRAIRWGTQERLSYRASDGLGLDGLLVLPPGRSRADGPFPLITLVHGGPDYRHADEFLLAPHPTGQWLATAGYAVFLPNPRGGVGHGRDFAAAVAGSVGGAEWSDITGGIDLLIAEGVADPGRLGIGGASHGGFMAAWAIGQTDRFKAAIMVAGISDWGMLVATGEGQTLEAALSGSCGWEGTGPHPHDRVSPISFASKVRTPVLIVNGEDDTNVPVSQAIYFHRALSWYGAEHELVIYPREGHGLVERNHQLDLLRRTRAWFDRWLRDEASDGRGLRSRPAGALPCPPHPDSQPRSARSDSAECGILGQDLVQVREGAGMPDFDITVPHISRVYDYWLGGKDNFAADRELGEQTRQAYPNIVDSVRANRAFLSRSVRFLTTEAGVRQFLDIGAGLPTADNIHEVAQREAPECRIVYADNDPVVLTHARALLRSTPIGSLAYLDADLRYPDMILAEAAKTLDLKKPVAIMLLTVLQFVPDDEAYDVVERLTAACAPGSYLVISHPASDIEADRHSEMVRRMNASMAQKVTLRDHASITRMFDGLKLVEPGVVKASQWRPESDAQAATPTVLWAGVAHKP